jgi:hypothetical protein
MKELGLHLCYKIPSLGINSIISSDVFYYECISLKKNLLYNVRIVNRNDIKMRNINFKFRLNEVT